MKFQLAELTFHTNAQAGSQCDNVETRTCISSREALKKDVARFVPS